MLDDKDDCQTLTDCSDFNECVCKVDDDDDGCGGCDIAGAGTGAMLSSVMMAIGLAALVISRRGRRS